MLVSSLVYDVIAKILDLYHQHTKIKDIEHHDFYAQRKIPIWSINEDTSSRRKGAGGGGGGRDMNAGECGTGVKAKCNSASNGIHAFDFPVNRSPFYSIQYIKYYRYENFRASFRKCILWETRRGESEYPARLENRGNTKKLGDLRQRLSSWLGVVSIDEFTLLLILLKLLLRIFGSEIEYIKNIRNEWNLDTFPTIKPCVLPVRSQLLCKTCVEVGLA